MDYHHRLYYYKSIIIINMKHLLSFVMLAALLISVGCGTTSNTAIDTIQPTKEARSALNAAKSAFSKYTQDRGANAGELTNAITSIGTAMTDEGIKGKAAAWLLKGQIFNEVMSDQTGIFSGKYPNAVDKAYEAFQMVSKVGGGKKFELEAAAAALANVSAGFSMKGANLFGSGNYAEAAKAFMKTVEISEGMGIGDDNVDQQNALYNAGLAAINAGDNAVVKLAMGRLLKAGATEGKPNIFEGLYKAYAGEDENKALDFLAQGRKAFPQDNSLLTTEINHYLKSGKLEVLEDKLMMAIEQDPKNKTLYLVSGSMYEKLFNNAFEAKDMATADANFAKAEEFYNKSIEKDPAYFDAIYSLGALYFNKTTPMRKEMNDLPLSETARYDALKSEVTSLMGKALPFFIQADSINDKDYNTIFALKEIYARQDDLAKSNEYKVRLEALSDK